MAVPVWRVRLAQACDLAAAIMIAQALWTHALGGYRIGSEPFVLSTRSAGRIVLEAAVLLAVRHGILLRPSVRDRIAGWLRCRATALAPVPVREWTTAAAAYLPLTLLFLWPQVVLPGGVADRGDPLFSMWAISHVAERLIDAPLSLLDGGIFHPAPSTYAWSDMSLLSGLAGAPLVWAGVPVAHVFSTLMIGACWLSGVTMYGLARATGNAPPASWVSGALFAFVPYRFAHYSHLPMQGIFLLPLVVWAAIRVLEAPSPRRAAALAGITAMQVWWSTYLGAFAIVVLGGVAGGWWLSGRALTRGHLRSLLVTTALGTVLLTPYLLGVWHARGTVGERPRGEVGFYSARPADFASPNEAQAWYRTHAPIHTKNAELHLSAGIAPWMLTAAGLAGPPTTATVMAGAGLLVALDGTLGLNGATYTLLYDYLPVLRPFRVPARFALLAALFMSWLAAVALTRLWERSPAVGWRATCLVLMAAAVAETRPALALEPIPTAAPPIYAALPETPSVVLELPSNALTPGAFPIDPWYMYMATFHEHRLVNGFSGHFPPWFAELGKASADLPAESAIKKILASGADFVIVHEEFYGPERYRAVVDGLGHRPQFDLVGTARSAGGEDRLYRLIRN